MADFVDPGPDPAFPDRPDHPHFRLLSELTQQADQRVEAGEDVATAFFGDEKIDMESVTYFCLQRGQRARRQFTQELPQVADPEILRTVRLLAAASEMDGFLLGYLFAVNRPDLP